MQTEKLNRKMSILIKMTRQNIQLSPTIPMDKFALMELLKIKKIYWCKNELL